MLLPIIVHLNGWIVGINQIATRLWSDWLLFLVVHEKVNTTKYPAVYIDHRLIWKDHIAYISSKLSKCTAVIHKTSHVLDTKTLTLLYNTIISITIIYYLQLFFYYGNMYNMN